MKYFVKKKTPQVKLIQYLVMACKNPMFEHVDHIPLLMIFKYAIKMAKGRSRKENIGQE
jgi:hypothetical protein